MPISHAQPITLTCPACGTSHTADIWLIVAPDERPDLVEQIRNGTLHTATCPQCGQTRTLDAPLLIFRPTAEPPILFAPAQQTSTEQDQQHAAELIGILRQHLGAAWNDAWLAQGPAVVPRPMLLVALTDDPALVQAVNAFLNARTWIDSYRQVQAHPELLSDEALAMLDQAIAAARAANNADAVAFFEEHRALLRRCREVGAAAAFAEKIGVRVEELERREARGAVPAVFASWLATAQQAERRFLQTGDRNALTTAVEAWRQILEHPAFQTAPLEFRCAVLNNAGGTFLRCYWTQGRAADLERALTFCTEALAATPPDSPDRPSILNNLGVGLCARYDRSGRLEELDAAIAAYEQALDTTPPDSPDRPSILNNLGRGLHARSARSGRLEDLDAAIAAYEQALDTTPPDSPDRPSRLNNLGTGLRDRSARSGRLEDLDAAIAAWQQALDTTPPDSPDRPSRLNNLGTGLRDRSARSGRLEDLDAAIAAWQQALDTTPPDSPDRPGYLNNLGIGLRDRSARSGRLEDLDAAIAAWQQALDTTPPDSPDRPSRLNNLGTGLRDRSARSGRLEDLDAAIAAWQQALAATPPDSPDRPGYLNNLGNGLRDRSARSGRLEDLDAAIAAWQQALAATPPDSPDRPSILNNLGTGLRDRSARSGRLEDLDAAIAAYEQALDTTPPDSPDRPSILNNLGNGLRARSARSGRLEDLDAAIAAYEQALAATPPDSPDRPGYLNNLGNGLRARYARSGRLEDLDAAIAAWQQALDTTPPDSPDRPGYLNNLGIGLRARSARSGRLEDLDAAIAAWQQALDTTPPDSPDRPGYLNNLGIGLRDRSARSGRLEDLDAAIAAWQQALDTTPPDSPDRPSRLNNLGTGLRDRYARSGRLEDLDAAIAAYEQALDTTPPDSPDRPSRLNNLGNGLRDRSARSGRLEDLDAAIAAYEQALAATPPDSPDRPSILNNLGNGLRARYARSGRLEDLKQARRSYALACKQGQLLAPDIALTASQSWGRWAGERHHWKEAAYAFGFGLETIEQLHRAQMRRSDQESWLSAARGLHTSAAYALVRAARPGVLRRAVEVAELGRARGLGETLARDRSDLSIIERDYPDIYERYRAAAEVVRSLERTDRATTDRQDEVQLSFTDLANRIRTARADLDAAIEAIRAIPGYEAFLRPPAYAEIAAAAQPGVPLVYLITTSHGSLALIVPHGNVEPEALLLDEFTENNLNNILLMRTGDEVTGGYLPGQLLGGETLETALEMTLPILGERLIAPLAQRLRALNATGVTLIPTGLLSLLPLHAATYTVNGASRCLLDEFDVAYAPSARVLAIAQREQQRRAAKGVRLAGVGNPLPSDETGDWALAELRRGLPNLRQQVQQVLPSLEAAAVRADPAMQKQIQDLLEIWRSTLTRLEELAQQTPEKVIKAGSDLARAAAFFAALPADAGAFLSAIAARIPPSLTYARSELISILDLLPANAGAPLYEQQATREALWAALSAATIAHFACHGQFGLDDTLDSALLLAQESRLTLRDLVAGDTTAMSNLRLVALSACQTAITDFRRLPDESIGLPGGFLQAGVPAVIGTLWSINDLSTALLMHRFYELHLHGDAAAGLAPQPPVRALRLAQQWLRDLTYKEMFAYFQRHRQLKAAPQRNLESVPVSGARMPTDLIEEGRALAEDYMLDHPNNRPYANPIFWAAFTFNGTIGGAA
jgi:CHAT domain-containing protein